MRRDEDASCGQLSALFLFIQTREPDRFVVFCPFFLDVMEALLPQQRRQLCLLVTSFHFSSFFPLLFAPLTDGEQTVLRHRPFCLVRNEYIFSIIRKMNSFVKKREKKRFDQFQETSFIQMLPPVRVLLIVFFLFCFCIRFWPVCRMTWMVRLGYFF